MTEAQVESIVHAEAENVYRRIYGVGSGTSRLQGAVEQRTIAEIREGMKRVLWKVNTERPVATEAGR